MTRSALLLLPLPLLTRQPLLVSAPLRKTSLQRKLLRAVRRGEPVALGTAARPWDPEDRSPLEALRHADGLKVSIVTRSPALLRDLGLLADLDRRCSVLVDVPISATDPEVARRIEPHAPEPAERLELVARLAAEGIAVRVLWTPVLPGMNNGEAALRPLLAAAREAGAWDVVAEEAPPRRLAAWLSPGRGAALPAAFRRLRLEHGFPRAMAGRG
jgi:DNA repair photolyase